MAEIKMDVTEYESLKKNITLLEEAKGKQKKLHEEIDKLREEQIQILANSQHQVIIRKEITLTEVKLCSVNPHQFEAFARDLFISRDRNFDSGPSISSYGSHQYLQESFVRLVNSLPSTRLTSTHEEPAIYKGLDEMREDIRKELEDALNLKVKDALKFKEDFESQQKEYFHLNDEVVPYLATKITELEELTLSLSTENIEKQEKLDGILYLILNLCWSNANKIKRQIREYIQKKQIDEYTKSKHE